MKKLLFLVAFNFGLLTLNCFAQNRNIDSLFTLLKKDKPDTNKVFHSNNLCRELRVIGLYDTAFHYANAALKLSQQLSFKKGIADSHSNIGILYCIKGDNSKALEYWLTALKINEELKDKSGIARQLGNIGMIYEMQSDYSNARNYYFKALKMAEELGDKNLIANNLLNIGIVYDDQDDYSKALDYYFKAMKIYEELKNKNGIARLLGNIGIIYKGQNDYPKALNYFFRALKMAEEQGDKNLAAKWLCDIGSVYYEKDNSTEALDYYCRALKIFEELGNKDETASTLANIGRFYYNQSNFPKTLDCYFKALKIFEELKNKSGIATTLGHIGTLYTKTGKFKEAEVYLKKSIAMNASIGTLFNLKEFEEALSQLYDTTGQHKLALIHYKKAIALKDTLFSQENKKQLVRKEMQFEFDKKEAISIAENKNQQIVFEERNRKQKIITWSVFGGLLLVLAFAGFVFRTLRITRRQKKIIEIKNRETEQQKKIIEENNKDMKDSIRYAKRIQNALLREEEHVSMHLPQHFILFLPKDIVSGDFYWGAEKQGYWYFAAVDCTGHGVPGAVMSMLGISFLNEIVSVEGLHSPAEILNRLRDRVVKELRQTGESGGSKDGMDISLVRLNLETNELQWAGANNGLNLIRNEQLEEIKGDKQPIGYYPESFPFTNHNAQLQKGDSIYIYTDGYADQFGGPRGKKFKYRQLEDIILSNKNLPMEVQKERFKKSFNEWKGKLEQVDDVTIFGVCI